MICFNIDVELLCKGKVRGGAATCDTMLQWVCSISFP